MTIKSKVDEILDDDSNHFQNRAFGLISDLARELENEVAKLKMENEELQKRLSLANRQTDAAYNCGFSGIVPRMFPTFGR